MLPVIVSVAGGLIVDISHESRDSSFGTLFGSRSNGLLVPFGACESTGDFVGLVVSVDSFGTGEDVEQNVAPSEIVDPAGFAIEESAS